MTNARVLGHLHADKKGEIRTIYGDGLKYFITIVDDYSRYLHSDTVWKKGEAPDAVLSFIKIFEKQQGTVVRSWHTDGGNIFQRAQDALRTNGVEVSTRTSYNPAFNRLSARYHVIVISMTFAARLHASFPTWRQYALRHLTTRKNMVLHSETRIVPFDTVYGYQFPELQYPAPFGCHLLYQPVMEQLPAFSHQLEEVLLFGHDDGCVYLMITESGFIRTKMSVHMKMSSPVYSFYVSVRFQHQQVRKMTNHMQLMCKSCYPN